MRCLAHTQLFLSLYRDPQTFSGILKMAGAEARRAIELDPDESSALAALSWVVLCDAHYAAALELAEHAISINANDVGAYLTKGRTLFFQVSRSRRLNLCLPRCGLANATRSARWC